MIDLEDKLKNFLLWLQRILAHFPVVKEDGSVEMFIGYRIQHNTARGPIEGGKGGVRVDPNDGIYLHPM